MPSFFTDRWLFTYQPFSPEAIVYKMVFLGLLLILWQLVPMTILAWKVKDDQVIAPLKYAVAYFLLMCAFLLMTWPGGLAQGEFTMIYRSQNLQLYFWQHYLTSILFIFSLMLLPFPAGLLIVQIAINSLIVGAIVYRLTALFPEVKYRFCLYLPFLLCPVIMNSALRPVRMGIYALLLCYYFFTLICWTHERKALTYLSVMAFSTLTALLIVWRAEGAVLLLLAPLGFCLLLRHSTTRRQQLAYIAGIVLFSLLLSYPQTEHERHTLDGKLYKITAFFNPLSMMLQSPLHSPHLHDDYASLQKVIDLDALRRQPSYTDIQAFFEPHSLVNTRFSDAAFRPAVAGFLDLVLHNPGVFLDARAKTFLSSSSLDGRYFARPAPAITILRGNSSAIFSASLYHHPLSMAPPAGVFPVGLCDGCAGYAQADLYILYLLESVHSDRAVSGPVRWCVARTRWGVALCLRKLPALLHGNLPGNAGELYDVLPGYIYLCL